MCTLHTYCCKTGILHYAISWCLKVQWIIQPPYLLALLHTYWAPRAEQSCINKFWLLLQLQFHAWPFLRYIQSKIKERKYLYKSFYEISYACNKPIPPELKWTVKMSLQSLDQANTVVLLLCPPVWGGEFRTTMKLQSTVGADFKGHGHISVYVHK